MILYVCTCGWSTEDAHEAFLHRSTDGDGGSHHLRPETVVLAEPTGIDKYFSETPEPVHAGWKLIQGGRR